MRYSVRPTAVVLLAAMAACTGTDEKSASAQTVGDTIGSARRTGVIAPSTSPYRAVAITDAGKINGSVVFEGTPPGDTTIVVPADQNGCGKPLVIQRLVRHAGRVAGVLVWLTDVRAGRAIPVEKRFELDNNDCAWDPVIQATLAGGTLNVVNYDPLVERALATDVATGDTVAVAPFTDNGQLIPYDKLLKTPGLYEFSAESRPMSRAWVAVFDQPYFAITDANGNFTLDGVPPGVHRIRAWQPMLGAIDGTATVAANGTVTSELRFGAR